MQFLAESLLELITQTSTNCRPDVPRGHERRFEARDAEQPRLRRALNVIASNIDMAETDEGPICQDTGMPTFYVHTPLGR